MKDNNNKKDHSPMNMTIQHQRVGKEHIRIRVRNWQENRKCAQNYHSYAAFFVHNDPKWIILEIIELN